MILAMDVAPFKVDLCDHFVFGGEDAVGGEDLADQTAGQKLALQDRILTMGDEEVDLFRSQLQKLFGGMEEGAAPGADIVHDQDGSLRTLFNMILKTYIEKEPNHHAICNGLLETICATVDRNRSVTYKHPFVVDLKRRIYENMTDPDFSVTDEIQRMGYNPDHVRRSFYTDIGVSPHRYLINLRLTLAKKRLQNESFMSIEGVARECGFGDAFYFSRLFKKAFGVSPREYRGQEEK